MKEIEILIELKSSKEETLAALGQFTAKGVKKTLDVYFYDPLREDLKPDEKGRLKACLRVRNKGGTCLVAYKNDHFIGDEWSHSDEYETEAGSFDMVTAIFQKLGFKELVRVENEKHIFISPQYEIVFEDVKDLGLFLEVERISQVGEDEVVQAKTEIRAFLQTLSLQYGEEQNAGKPELLLRKKSTK